MSTVTPPDEHRLAVAEGLLLALGSGPRSLDAARAFLGRPELSIDECAVGLEQAILEAQTQSAPSPGDDQAAEDEDAGTKKAKSRKKASSATGADIPTTGHDTAGDSFITLGTSLAQIVEGGVESAGALDPDGDGDVDVDHAPDIEVTPPPNLRYGTNDESCSRCVFFNKGACTKYGIGRSGAAADTIHIGGYPVLREQLCDSFDTLSVAEARIAKRTQEIAITLSEVKSDVYPGLDRSPKQNWVDKTGGLPSYIERIAKHVHYEHGKDIGRSIQIAVGVVQRWCKGGGVSARGGVKVDGANASGVSAATKAKACAALAEWDAKRAASKTTTAAKKVTESEALAVVDEHGFWALSLREAAALAKNTDWDPARDGVSGFKLPSFAYCEQIIREVEEAYADWDEWQHGFSPSAWAAISEGELELSGVSCATYPHLDEAALGRFDELLHPRSRSGEFSPKLGTRTRSVLDDIGKAAKAAPKRGFSGERAIYPSSTDWPGGRKEIDGRIAAQGRDHGHAYPGSLEDLFATDKPAPAPKHTESHVGDEFAIDHAIGGVVSSFPNIGDWNLEGPKNDAAGKHWVVHVKLTDGHEHHIRVGEDGSVSQLEAMPTAQPSKGKTLYGHHEVEPTGLSEEPYHMENGQLYMGGDGHLYQKLEHGPHLMTAKNGNKLAGVRILNHDTGTEKLAPAFALKHSYPMYQLKGSAPVHKPAPAPAASDLYDSLMSSVKGEGHPEIAGKHFVITGTIPGMSRTEATAKLTLAGGLPHSSVSNATDYLITGEGVGATKMAAAQKKGVKVIPYHKFPHLISESREVHMSSKKLRLEECLAELAEAADGATVMRLRARRDVLAAQFAREIEERDFTHARRMELAAEGKALPDGSYPIETEEDLHNAITLADSGHGNVAAAKALIAKRAAALGVRAAL